MVWGLDMRFLGRKWQKKNNSASKGNRTSCLALQSYAPSVPPTRRSAGSRVPSSAELLRLWSSDLLAAPVNVAVPWVRTFTVSCPGRDQRGRKCPSLPRRPAFFQERELIFIDSDTQSLIPCSAKGRVVHPKQRNCLFPPCGLALVKFGHKKCFGSEERRLVWDI